MAENVAYENGCPFYESFMKLNDYQKKAVMNESKALLLNAGVGSGKTTVLVHKVLYLYHVKKIPLSKMVVLTFTNKAAEEIKERVLSSGEGLDMNEIKYFGTFHSVARLLLSSILPVEEIGYTKDFSVLDENGSKELFDAIIEKNGLSIKYRQKIEKRLEKLKHGKKLYGNMKYEDEIEKLLYIYKCEKKAKNLMDFDDLIENCTNLLRRTDFKPSWVIIDEFQDTDDKQFEMLDALIKNDTSVFAVGDPNQIIYTWRGSREDIFDIFKERYDAAELNLPINYRSTANILDAAKAFLNDPKGLLGVREKGSPIVVKRHYNSFNEALYLADKINKLKKQGIPYKEIAILYRKQKHSKVFEDVFKHENIPYEVSLKKDFKDIPSLYWFMRLMKASLNHKDTDSLKFVLSDKKYGPESDICSFEIKIKNFSDWCMRLKDSEGLALKLYDYFDIDSFISPTSISYEEDKNYILKYINQLEEYIKINKTSVIDGIKSALENSALYGLKMLEEIIDPEKDSVKLMTLHACKGLEFKYVFISGANFGIIPLGGRFEDEEEKRLFFVGLTRAKDYIEISYHSSPEDFEALPRPSPFISMIPDELIESDEVASRAYKLSDMRREIKSNMETNSVSNFEKRKVSHPKYGDGYIKNETDDMITVEFEGYGEKSFTKVFCPLKFL